MTKKKGSVRVKKTPGQIADQLDNHIMTLLFKFDEAEDGQEKNAVREEIREHKKKIEEHLRTSVEEFNQELERLCIEYGFNIGPSVNQGHKMMISSTMEDLHRPMFNIKDSFYLEYIHDGCEVETYPAYDDVKFIAQNCFNW